MQILTEFLVDGFRLQIPQSLIVQPSLKRTGKKVQDELWALHIEKAEFQRFSAPPDVFSPECDTEKFPSHTDSRIKLLCIYPSTDFNKIPILSQKSGFKKISFLMYRIFSDQQAGNVFRGIVIIFSNFKKSFKQYDSIEFCPLRPPIEFST